MSRAIGDLLTTLSYVVPWRVLVPSAAAAALLLIPLWVESMRERQIRGLVRRLVRAEGSEREALDRRLRELIGGKASRLRVLVESATRYDLRALRERALAELEAAGGRADARRFREAAAAPRHRFRDPVEAALHVEALLQEGRTVAAAEKLAEARRSFPADPELLALERQLAAGPPPPT